MGSKPSLHVLSNPIKSEEEFRVALMSDLNSLPLPKELLAIVVEYFPRPGGFHQMMSMKHWMSTGCFDLIPRESTASGREPTRRLHFQWNVRFGTAVTDWEHALSVHLFPIPFSECITLLTEQLLLRLGGVRSPAVPVVQQILRSVSALFTAADVRDWTDYELALMAEAKNPHTGGCLYATKSADRYENWVVYLTHAPAPVFNASVSMKAKLDVLVLTFGASSSPLPT